MKTLKFGFVILIVAISFNVCNAQFKGTDVLKHSTLSTASISLRKIEMPSKDTFWISIYDDIVSSHLPPDTTIFATKNENNEYTFRINFNDKPMHISLFSNRLKNGYPKYIMELYLVEPGDNITIDILKDSENVIRRFINYGYYSQIYNTETYQMKFYGNSVNKYRCRYEMDQRLAKDTSKISMVTNKGDFIANNHCDVGFNIDMRILESYKNKISNTAYYILLADLYSTIELERLFWLSLDLNVLIDTIHYRKIYDGYQSKIKNSNLFIPSWAKILSSKYSLLISERQITDRLVNLNCLESYQRIKKLYSGRLKDKILVSYAIRWIRSTYGQSILHDVLTTIKIDSYSSYLYEYFEQNSKGNSAYNFSLPDINGKKVKLEDFRGKVIFLDFWFSGCMFCRKYYQDVLRKVEPKFKDDSSVVFISINVDIDRNIWIQNVNTEMYTSSTSINLNTEGKGADHPVVLNYFVWAYPQPLVIDKNGKIFSTNNEELKKGGVEKLTVTIERALAAKSGSLN